MPEHPLLERGISTLPEIAVVCDDVTQVDE